MSDASDLSVTDDTAGQDGEYKGESRAKDGSGVKAVKKDHKKEKDKLHLHHHGLTGALANAGISTSGVGKRDKKEKKEKKEK